MLPPECPICAFAFTTPASGDVAVVLCPQCGYCVEVPPPWDDKPVDAEVMAAIVRPGGEHHSFADERRAAHRQYLMAAVSSTFLGIGLLGTASFSPHMRLLSVGLGSALLVGAVLFLLAVLLERKRHGRPSVVTLPEQAAMFVELGRPICVIQDTPTIGAMVIAVGGAVMVAAAFLVMAYGVTAYAVENGPFILLLFSLCALGASGMLLYYAAGILFFPLRAWVFEGGFVRARGNRIVILPWDQVRTIDVRRQTVRNVNGAQLTSAGLTIEGAGQQLRFGFWMDLESRDVERLAHAVQAAHASAMARGAQAETS